MPIIGLGNPVLGVCSRRTGAEKTARCEGSNNHASLSRRAHDFQGIVVCPAAISPNRRGSRRPKSGGARQFAGAKRTRIRCDDPPRANPSHGLKAELKNQKGRPEFPPISPVFSRICRRPERPRRRPAAASGQGGALHLGVQTGDLARAGVLVDHALAHRAHQF